VFSASKLAALFLILLGAVPAFSVNSVPSLSVLWTPNTTSFAVTAAMCSSSQALAFTVNGSANVDPGSGVNVYVLSTRLVSGACPTTITFPNTFPTTTAANVFIGSPGYVPFTSSGAINLTAASFNNPTVQNLNSEICGGTVQIGVTYGLCAYGVDSVTNQILATSQPALISPSTTPATISVTGTPSAQDGRIQFNVTTNQNEPNGINVCYIKSIDTSGTFDTTQEGDLNALAGQQGTSTTQTCTASGLLQASIGPAINGSSSASATSTFTLGGLENDFSYKFLVQGQATFLWSTPVQGPLTPAKKYSTLELYTGEGNAISWACSQSAGPVNPASLIGLGLLFAAALFVSPSRRRRSLRFLGMGMLCVTMMGQSAHADAGQFLWGITGTFYKPNFDKNTPGYPVYADLYGGAWMPKLGMDFDWHVFDGYGSLQLGFATSFAWATGLAANFNSTFPYTASGSPVAMYLLRLDPRVTWAFDPYVECFPLVPFVQAGIDMAGYYITYQGDPDRNGETRGLNPLGMKFGWQVGAGLMFLLDWIEPEVSASARALGTYNHTYLKASVSFVKLDDFGGRGFDLSPAHFGPDVPLQLDFAAVFEFQ